MHMRDVVCAEVGVRMWICLWVGRYGAGLGGRRGRHGYTNRGGCSIERNLGFGGWDVPCRSLHIALASLHDTAGEKLTITFPNVPLPNIS